jgi:hypothetical protein
LRLLCNGGNGFGVEALEGRRKKVEESCHFRHFGHDPLSTGIRWANVVSSSHLVYCRGSTIITGGTQGVWEEDLCGCCIVATFGGCHGEFFVVFLNDFQFYFPTPFHAYFRLLRAAFDLELNF